MALVSISGAGFPRPNSHLNTTWSQEWSLPQLALAAFLSGRHPRDRFEFGIFSLVDMVQRMLAIWTHIRVDEDQFVRSGLYIAADRSEKVGVSYLLGQAVTHLFLTTVVGVPYTLHVDRYADEYALTWQNQGLQRPDLIGLGSGWVVAEAKGRTWGPSTDSLNTAIAQKHAIATIDGAAPYLRVAAISHFLGGALALAVHDPEASVRGVDLPGSRFEFLRRYYYPMIHLTRGGVTRNLFGSRARFADLPGLDASLGLAEGVVSAMRSESTALRFAEGRALEWQERQHADDTRAINASGVALLLGASWKPELMARQPWRRDKGLATHRSER